MTNPIDTATPYDRDEFTQLVRQARKALAGDDLDPWAPVVSALDGAVNEVERLKAAVREHHDQKGDDRCHLDDRKLYHAVLGEGVDPYVGALPPDEDMLESCRRYIAQRRCPGPQGVVPLPGDMTIAQLTAEVERLRAERDAWVKGPSLACSPRPGLSFSA